MRTELHPHDACGLSFAAVLRLYRVPELDLLCGLVSALPEAKNKEARIAALLAAMQGERLRRVWERLSEPQQAAVSMAVHAREGRFNRRAFRKRHGAPPDFGRLGMFQGLSEPTLLCLFIHVRHVPTDLRRELLKFVPEPAAVELRGQAEAPATAQSRSLDSDPKPRKTRVTVAETERVALAELSEVLQLVDSGRVEVTRRGAEVSADGIKAIGSVLAAPDFLDAVRPKTGSRRKEDAVRAFAWPRLLVVGGLARVRQQRLELTRRGRQALRGPPADALRGVWKACCTEASFDELERVEGVKGALDDELLPPFVRRAIIGDALRLAPVGAWVQVDDFFDALRESGLDFQVTRQPWSLSIEGVPDTPLDVLGEDDLWLVLQGRIILVLLCETLATLGLVDLAYSRPAGARREVSRLAEAGFISRYDGLRAFRLTPLGAWCLGIASGYAATSAPGNARLQLAAGLEIEVRGEPSKADLGMLEACCEPLSPRRWRLERQRVLEAMAGGQPLPKLRAFLAGRSGRALPAEVAGFLEDCEARSRGCSLLGPGMLVECASEEIAARVAESPTTRSLCLRAGPRVLVVPQQKLPTFRAALRAVGFDLGGRAQAGSGGQKRTGSKERRRGW